MAAPDFTVPTRAEAVTEQLRRLIVSGEYPPGTRLRQAEIAARFHVSTTPVREAFTALAREGLVRHNAHRGVEVFAPSLDELNEIYDIRASLEPLGAELAAPRLSDDALDDLSEIVHKMRTAPPAQYAELNEAFHADIYAAAGRPRLVDLIVTLREASRAYLRLTVKRYDAGYRDQVQREHEAILEALRAREPKQAAKLVHEHLVNNQRHVARLVELSY